MAENESLDLDGHSKHWRRLLAKIEHNESVDDCADAGVRCLYKIFKALLRLHVPLDEVLGAADRRDHQAIRDIMRQCPSARDFLQLFLYYATIHCDRMPLLESVARAAVETILDQIEIKWIGRRPQADIASFRALRPKLITGMGPGIAKLARCLATAPTNPPRMPAKPPERREQEHHELLELSLREP